MRKPPFGGLASRYLSGEGVRRYASILPVTGKLSISQWRQFGSVG